MTCIWEDMVGERVLALRSRVHPWFQLHPKLWLKRDDELSAAISGSKLRKLAALQHYWRQNNISRVVSCGAWSSNQLPALLQLVNEDALDLELHLWGREREHSSNHKLSRLLISSQRHKIIEYSCATDAYLAFDRRSAQLDPGKYLCVGEGASNFISMCGAMSLAHEIVEDSKQIDISQVFVDSGSGVSACALILGLALLESRIRVGVVLLAGSEQEFEARLVAFKQLLGQKGFCITSPLNYFFLRPCKFRSFGAVGRSLFNFIKTTAQDTGVLLDPIYSAKCAMAVVEFLSAYEEESSFSVMVHSGGLWALSGYMDKLLS